MVTKQLLNLCLGGVLPSSWGAAWVPYQPMGCSHNIWVVTLLVLEGMKP